MKSGIRKKWQSDYELYPEALKKYLIDLKKSIPHFIEMGCKELAWSQVLLISIDEGYGVTSFIKDLGRIFNETNATSYSLEGASGDHVIAYYKSSDNKYNHSLIPDLPPEK